MVEERQKRRKDTVRALHSLALQHQLEGYITERVTMGWYELLDEDRDRLLPLFEFMVCKPTGVRRRW